MSSEITIAKRKGRPKKAAKVIVVADEPAIPAKRPRTTRKSAKAVIEEDVEAVGYSGLKAASVEKKKMTSAKTVFATRNSKEPEEEDVGAKKIGDARASAETTSAPSAMLEQADAFAVLQEATSAWRTKTAEKKPAAAILGEGGLETIEATKDSSKSPTTPATPEVSFKRAAEKASTTVHISSAAEVVENSPLDQSSRLDEIVGSGEETSAAFRKIEEQPTDSILKLAVHQEHTTTEQLLQSETISTPAPDPRHPTAAPTSPQPPPSVRNSSYPPTQPPRMVNDPPLPAPSKSSKPTTSSPPKPKTLHPSWTTSKSTLPTKTVRLPVSPAPVAPKLSQLPYSALKKVPEYRRASRKVTNIMVAIPIMLVTSYVLFQRFASPEAAKKKSRIVLSGNGGI